MNIDKIEGTTKLQVAYAELTKKAFSAWIMLMMATPRSLVGRDKIAKHLGLSTSHSNAVLRELKNKGYINVVRHPKPGNPSKIIILRRAMISGRNLFVNIAHGAN